MKKLLLIVTIFLVVIAIPATVYLVTQRQELRNKAAPATTISLVPTTITKSVGDEFSLEVHVDTGENQVIAAELHLTFDPNTLEATTITNGPLFPNVLASGTVEAGGASITVGAPSSTQPVTGTGTIAIARFKALAATTSPISVRFSDNTIVTGLGENTANVLVSSAPALVTITGGESPGDQTSTPSGQLTTDASGQEATGGATFMITSPPDGGAASTNKPTIAGIAPPGATVTITIYSDPITAVITADTGGNWTYTPNASLDAGPHTIVATAQTANQTTLTTTGSFVIAAGASGSGSTSSATSSETASESVIPVSGSAQNIIVILAIAFLLIGAGITISFVAR